MHSSQTMQLLSVFWFAVYCCPLNSRKKQAHVVEELVGPGVSRTERMHSAFRRSLNAMEKSFFGLGNVFHAEEICLVFVQSSGFSWQMVFCSHAVWNKGRPVDTSVNVTVWDAACSNLLSFMLTTFIFFFFMQKVEIVSASKKIQLGPGLPHPLRLPA